MSQMIKSSRRTPGDELLHGGFWELSGEIREIRFVTFCSYVLLSRWLSSSMRAVLEHLPAWLPNMVNKINGAQALRLLSR